jgi:hypothetical protein
MPVDEQTHLDQAWRDNLLSTLLGRHPVCVLRLLEDAVVSLLDPKTPSFTGGGGQLGTVLPTILEGTPLESSALNMKLYQENSLVWNILNTMKKLWVSALMV